MEGIVAAVMGALTGSGAGKTNKLVDAGVILNFLAGAGGGWLGNTWFGDAAARALSDSSLAGSAVAGAGGGIVAAVIVGTVWQQLRRRRSRQV